jgi:hypothetical protein
MPTVLPLGQNAVGVAVCRDFGEQWGIHEGDVSSVKGNGTNALYHIIYADGDEEDMDAGQYEYAYHLYMRENGEDEDSDIEEESYIPPKKKQKKSSNGYMVGEKGAAPGRELLLLAEN